MRFKKYLLVCLLLVLVLCKCDTVHADVDGQLYNNQYNLIVSADNRFPKTTLTIIESSSNRFIVNNREIKRDSIVKLPLGYAYRLSLKGIDRNGIVHISRKNIDLREYRYSIKDIDWYGRLLFMWTALRDDKEARVSLAKSLEHHLCKELGIIQIPKLVFKDLSEDVRAYYSSEANEICVSSDVLEEDNLNILGRLAHELRHAWQFEYMNTHDDELSRKLLDGYSNYLEHDDEFTEYENQFVEKDASEFSKCYDNLNKLLYRQKLLSLYDRI